MPVRNLRDVVSIISDAAGSGGGNALTLVLEEGNLAWTERRPVHIIRGRATLHHARQASEEPVEFSMTLKFQSFQDPNSATETPYEAFTGTGAASAWATDASNGGDAYAVIMEFTFNDPSGGTDETVTFTEAYAEEIAFAEGEEFDTLVISGRALITVPAFT